MSYNSLLIDEVTPYTESDDPMDVNLYGDPRLSYSAGDPVPARVQQDTATEDLADRDTSKTMFLVFLHPDADLTGVDYLDWNGRRLNVRGEPALVENSIGPHHVELLAEEVLGG